LRPNVFPTGASLGSVSLSMAMDANARVGCGCILLSAFVYAMQGVLSKFCTDRQIDVVAVNASSCLTQCILSAVVTIFYLGVPRNIRKSDIFSILIQGVFNSTAILLWFASYLFLEVGDASALAYAYPLYLPFMCRIFLGEITPWYTWLATLTSLFGMTLISRPAAIFGASGTVTAGMSPEGHSTGIALAAGSAISFAFYIIAARRLGEAVHAIVSAGGMAFAGVAIVCPIAWLVQGGTGFLFPSSLSMWLWTFPVGVAGFLATVLATAGYQRAPAAQGAVLSLLDVVFSFIAQAVIFGQPLDPLSVAGASIILFGCVLQTLMAVRDANMESEASAALEESFLPPRGSARSFGCITPARRACRTDSMRSVPSGKMSSTTSLPSSSP